MTIDIKTYMSEFVLLTGLFQKSVDQGEEEKCFTKKNILYVSNKRLVELMNENRFEEAKVKLKVWKSLDWILYDKDQYSIRVSYKGKMRRMIGIRLKIYQAIIDNKLIGREMQK